MWEWGKPKVDYTSCEKRTNFIKEDLDYLLSHLENIKDNEETIEYIYRELGNIHDRIKDLCDLAYRTKEKRGKTNV